MTTKIRETAYNMTENCWLGDGSDWYEPFTEDRGRLFRFGLHEHGRCIGKVGNVWTFQKRVKYEDCDETFLMHTMVEVSDNPDDWKPDTLPPVTLVSVMGAIWQPGFTECFYDYVMDDEVRDQLAPLTREKVRSWVDNPHYTGDFQYITDFEVRHGGEVVFPWEHEENGAKYDFATANS